LLIFIQLGWNSKISSFVWKWNSAAQLVRYLNFDLQILEGVAIINRPKFNFFKNIFVKISQTRFLTLNYQQIDIVVIWTRVFDKRLLPVVVGSLGCFNWLANSKQLKVWTWKKNFLFGRVGNRSVVLQFNANLNVAMEIYNNWRTLVFVQYIYSSNNNIGLKIIFKYIN